MDTRDFGWPISAPVISAGSKTYVDIRKGLSPFGFFNERQCKKGAYKQIEELLKLFGLSDIYLDKNTRTFVTAESFILTLIAGSKLRDPSNSCEHPSWNELCLFFAKTVVDATLSSDENMPTQLNATPLTQETMQQSSNNSVNDDTTAPGPKVYTGCIKQPDSTSTLALRLADKQTTRSTQLEERVKKQNKIFSDLAVEVHHGTKIDLLHGISQSVGRKFKQQNSETTWQGQFEKDDVTLLTKLIRNKTGESLYNEIAEEQATVKIAASTILRLEDQCNSGQAIDAIRKELPPGYIAPKREVTELKNKYKTEFQAIMQPERTATGYRINPARLVECLQFLYYWLPKEQWWHLYGDGRKYGKKNSVMMAISNVNNEQKLHGVKFQSPKEMWPIQIFHYKDSRRNLELNIGDGHGGPGYLNEWIENSQKLGHQVFLGADSQFLDAVTDPDLSPLSQDKWNLWMQCSDLDKGKVHPTTGLRTDLDLSFDRPHPKSLLPDLGGDQILMCIDHGFTRVAEKLIMKVVRTCLDLESRYGKERKNAALAHLTRNINSRDVRGGHFELPIDPKGQLGDLSLNKSQAYTIMAPPEDFQGKHYDHILDNVLPSCELQQTLSPQLAQALERTSQKISDIDCVKLIWWHFYQMYRILRKDTAQLKSGCQTGSTNIEDYEFGLQEAEIDRYIYHANIFHSLMVVRYGFKELSPYMMKFVDVVPKHLRSTPFKSLMRVATEGGERTHYMHMCFYYQHSTRDGGFQKPDTILTLLSWSYRNLRERINDCPERIRTDYEKYAQQHVAAYAIQKWWKTVHTRSNPPEPTVPEERVAQLLPLKKMDFVLAGRMPGTTQKKFTEKVEQNGGRVVSMPKENLPHDRCYLVCTQEEVKRDSSKLNSDLVTAYRRGWMVVKPSFVEFAAKEKLEPNIGDHLVDLTPLASMSSGVCGATQQSVEQLQFSKEISGFAALKRTIRQVERGPVNEHGNKSQKRNHKKKRDVMVSPKKPPNGWTAFLNDKLKETVQNNQSPVRTERIAFLKSIQNMSDEWRQLSDEEKREYKQKAIDLHLKWREERRKVREETKENLRVEQLREKAYESFACLRNE